jgi:iron complex transport system substrate-binding protein
VRILSLLPSATEIVYALGLEDQLVGVTHECDWPAAARNKPAVSFSTLPPAATPAEIDRLVSASIGGGSPIYGLDEAAVRELRPDVVLTQDLCAVCAVPSGHVNEALEVLGCTAEVVSLDPSSLDEVVDGLLEVGRVAGAEARAVEVAGALRARLDAVRSAVGGAPRPRTFALEWPDPPFNGGHWVPQMLEVAGAEPVLASPGIPSVRVDWSDIAAARPEVVVSMPCGYGLEESAALTQPLIGRPELAAVDAVYVVDASGYFSRPGPRLVDGVEMLASVLHPGAVFPAAADAIRRLR